MKTTQYSHSIKIFAQGAENTLTQNNPPSTSGLHDVRAVKNFTERELTADRNLHTEKGSFQSKLKMASGSERKNEENNNFTGGIDIISHIYRTQPLSPEAIKSIRFTCADLNNYILNSEQENLRTGKTSPNTWAALVTCKDLSADILGMPYKKFDRIARNPAGRGSAQRINDRQMIQLLKLIHTDEKSRTLTELAEAGILSKDLLIKKFGSTEESIIKYEHLKPKHQMVFPMQSKHIEQVFKTLKSDAFIHQWATFGLFPGKENMECINKFGEYINFTHSNISNRILNDIWFDNLDLTGSSFDNCVITGCSFENACLNDVTMYNTDLHRCYMETSSPDTLFKELQEAGIKGLERSRCNTMRQ